MLSYVGSYARISGQTWSNIWTDLCFHEVTSYIIRSFSGSDLYGGALKYLNEIAF